MIETKARIDGMTVFQLLELQKYISARMTTLGSPPMTAEAGAKFKRGDLIEFHSTRKGRTVRARVDRVNGKSLSCHEVDTPTQKWRVSPGMCRMVGEDKPASLGAWVPVIPALAPGPVARPDAPAFAPAAPSAPSIPGAGAW